IPKILWQEIKSLVVIKRSGEVKQALLLPGEEYYLYQNLRLELESARQSVLRSDSLNLRSSIDLILTWTRRYFDTSNSAVINVMETLDKMRSVELKPELPDISSSLESLRAYIRENDSESSVADDTQ
ncbi:MAG: uroporphyrinogen-III C-methyltransferase, partial [Gammaproteobacteria bacterium]